MVGLHEKFGARLRQVCRGFDLTQKQLASVAGVSVDFLSLLELSEIPTYLNGEGDFQATRSVIDLIEASMEFDALKDYVDYLQFEVSRPREAEGILLSTLHSAKGREWDAVIIPGFQEGLIPLDGADLDEERNLAFVGMSRPRYHLTLTLNRSKPPSQFLARLPVQVSNWPSY